MNDAAKEKTHHAPRIAPAMPALLRWLLLLVVAFFLPQTRVWSFAAAPQPASAKIAAAVSDTHPENALVWQYDASDSLDAARGGVPAKLYHYTGEGNVGGILEKGLVPGGSGKVFTTPNGGLTPLQAQIELGLSPNRGLPGALLEIDAAAMQRAGITPSLGPLRVQPTRNAPGGGTELIFDQQIPAEFIRRVR